METITSTKAATLISLLNGSTSWRWITSNNKNQLGLQNELKRGRKEGLAEQLGRSEEVLSVCRHFPLSWQHGAAPSLHQGCGQPTNRWSEVGEDTPCPSVVVTGSFQPSPLLLTSRDGVCWDFSFLYLPGCVLVQLCAREHGKRSVVT